MLISSREKEIEMVVTILSQSKTLEYNKISILKIINILLKNIEFPKQNKVLKQLKVELNKKSLSFRVIEKLNNELKATNE